MTHFIDLVTWIPLRMKDVGNIYIHYVHPDDDITIS